MTSTEIVKLAALIVDAVKQAVDAAKALGLEIPGLDKAKEFEAALNEQAAKLIPAELNALALLVNAMSVRVDMQMAKLGESPTCEACGQPALQTIAHSPHTGQSEVSLSCSCGWTG